MSWTPFAVIKGLVVIGTVASLAHFADNATSISRYPEPTWITPIGVWLGWVPIGALSAFLLLKRRYDISFKIGAFILSVVLMTGLLHFAYGSMLTMSPISTTTVLAETASGIALLAALLFRLIAKKLPI